MEMTYTNGSTRAALVETTSTEAVKKAAFTGEF
jgi:hypothetical protein